MYNEFFIGRPPCLSKQELLSESYPIANSSNRTPHTNIAIAHPGDINYTVFVRKSCYCGADVMINADGNEVKNENCAL